MSDRTADAIAGAVIGALGACLVWLGVYPYWPGLEGRVPVFIYPMSVVAFAAGVCFVWFGVTLLRPARG